MSDDVTRHETPGARRARASEPVAVDPGLVGQILDKRFRIEARLAAGGFGVVYRAVHVRTGNEVALKVLHPALARQPRVRARFLREGATLTSLHHPHTVTTYEHVETGDLLFLVMELLRGGTLHDALRAEGRMSWPRMFRIARQVCDALGEAHALGVVHRDLKPANIHLESRGDDPDYVKVVDFGIAKMMRGSELEDDDELTNANELIGTFEYMAPEQISGDGYSGRSDIYALGVVLFEMITGTKPFAGASGVALFTQVLTSMPVAPSQRLPGLPAEVDAVIVRCLERDPARRYATVGELAAALDGVLGGFSPGPRPGAHPIGTPAAWPVAAAQPAYLAPPAPYPPPAPSYSLPAPYAGHAPALAPVPAAHLPRYHAAARGSVPPPWGAPSHHGGVGDRGREEAIRRLVWLMVLVAGFVLFTLVGRLL